jgi:hypothetical protein
MRNLIDNSDFSLFAKHDPAFSEITRLAQEVFECPIAMLAIVDMGRLRLKDIQGLSGAAQLPRHGGLSFNEKKTALMIAKDALGDDRFTDYARWCQGGQGSDSTQQRH